MITQNSRQAKRLDLLAYSNFTHEDIEKFVGATDFVVMTDGSAATFVANLLAGEIWKFSPPPVSVPHPFHVGCGDVVAGVFTFLLGRLAHPISRKSLESVMRFTQLVVAAHLGDKRSAQAMTVQYGLLREILQRDSGGVEDAGEIAA